MGLHQRQIGLKSIENVDWANKKILDIGCGNGELSIEILEKTNGEELAGIDPKPDRILEATEFAKSRNLKNVDFYVGNFNDLKIFSDDSFDAIFCNMAFQQFKKPRKSLSEMFRVLKIGGEAVINFNIEKSPVWIQQEILFNKYYGDPSKQVVVAKNIGENEFNQMTKSIGFSKISLSKANDAYYYESFEEVLGMMDVSFFSREKLSKEQETNLNKELKKYLESTRTEKGIPETWKILFAKLIK